MRSSSEILKSAVASARETFQSLVDLDAQIAKAAELIEKCLRNGNKLLVCGNGGSATDGAHFATEFVVRFAKDRPAYPAICLTGDGGLLTAAGNDYGFAGLRGYCELELVAAGAAVFHFFHFTQLQWRRERDRVHTR